MLAEKPKDHTSQPKVLADLQALASPKVVAVLIMEPHIEIDQPGRTAK